MMDTTTALLRLDNVSVARGEFVLCQGVKLTLHAGDICHLIGENGLGKTTLLNQISKLSPTHSGTLTLSARLLYVSHQLVMSKNLTVRQNLAFLLSLYGVKVTTAMLDDALDGAGLYGLGDSLSIALSAGQQRRVGLARLFILHSAHAPLWLLDEPLTALDSAMVARLEARIQAFAHDGGAVLMTIHQTINGANKHLDLTEYTL